MGKNWKWLWAGLALALGLGLTATAGLLTAAEAGGNDLGVDWVEYAVDLDQPVDIAFTGVATDTRMFVVERPGRIKVVEASGTVLATPFLSITTLVNSEAFGEMGLLGLVFDPDYANNGFFYVYYNDFADEGSVPNNGNIQLSRYQVSPDPNVALTTEVKLLTISHPTHTNHNGGDMAFGPDGYLYLAPGDGANGNNALTVTTLLGKVLRIDVTDVATYTVPASNPYTQTVGAKPEIWARGFRNPWRFSFDSLTGDLYIGDVGQNDWEEISRQPAASAGGEHYGWPCYEGTQPFNNSGCPPVNTLTMPVFDYNHQPGDNAAVTGGYVYRGVEYPALNGYYFFADYGSRRFWALNTATNAVTELGQMLVLGSNPSTFGQDPAGSVYVADNNFGIIYKLTGPLPLPVQTPSFLPMLNR